MRTAVLTLDLAADDWSATDRDVRQRLVRAHVRSLRKLYPRARIVVLVSVAGQIVWRTGA